MTMSAHTKSRVIGLIEQVTGTGLKVGIPVFIVAAGYLLYIALGPHLRQMAQMDQAHRAYLTNSVGISLQAFVFAGMVIVGSLILRMYGQEVVGQGLSVAGALLYFGGPALLAFAVPEQASKGNVLLAEVVGGFRYVGGVCLLPGLTLVLRDAILRIWTGISVKRIMERRWGDEEQRKRKSKPKIYGNCWDLEYCRDFVRQSCPAFTSKKSCWRLKVGCYCDERTVMQAIANYGGKDEHAKNIMHRLGLDGPGRSQLTNAQKRARCRRCGIYSEHQRQKYRVLSPAVFPAAALLFYLSYNTVAMWMGTALAKTDQFLRFLTYKTTDTHYQIGTDSHMLTVVAMVWVAIILVSYSLRLLEYLVFELQV